MCLDDNRQMVDNRGKVVKNTAHCGLWAVGCGLWAKETLINSMYQCRVHSVHHQEHVSCCFMVHGVHPTGIAIHQCSDYAN